MKKGVSVVLVMVLALSIGFAQGAKESTDYPTRDITMICGWGGGSSADVTCRIVAQIMEKELGVNVKVQNLAGTAGAVGYTELLNAAPDGQTIGMGTITLITHSLLGTVPFSYEDFTPLGTVLTDASVLFISPKAPFNNLDSMIAYSKANPRKATIAVSSLGGQTNLAARLLEEYFDVDWNLVAGASSGIDGATQCAGGHVHMCIASPNEGKAFVDSGDLIPLFVTVDSRVSTMPNVPTTKELGIDFTIGNMRGFFGPKNLQKNVVAVLERAILKATEDEQFRKNVDSQGAVITSLDATGTLELWKSKTEEFRSVLSN